FTAATPPRPITTTTTPIPAINTVPDVDMVTLLRQTLLWEEILHHELPVGQRPRRYAESIPNFEQPPHRDPWPIPKRCVRRNEHALSGTRRPEGDVPPHFEFTARDPRKNPPIPREAS